LPDFTSCLTGPEHQVSWDASPPAPVDVSGILWGGNLAMFNHLVGTPYLPEIEGGILFFEDVAEHPFRIERMLLQLHYSGILARQKAIVLGDFSAYMLTAFDNGYDFDQMLAYVRAQLSIPVLTGLPFGHTSDKVTLVVGSQARLWSDAHQLHLKMHDYPCL
jgi:muramoyltetrapeptide carboxypeptidase